MNKLCLLGAAALIATAFLPDAAFAQRGGGRGGGMGFHGGGMEVVSAGAVWAAAFGEGRSAGFGEALLGVVFVVLRSVPASEAASVAAASAAPRSAASAGVRLEVASVA